jgi:hypothetical protein
MKKRGAAGGAEAKGAGAAAEAAAGMSAAAGRAEAAADILVKRLFLFLKILTSFFKNFKKPQSCVGGCWQSL